jgi:Carboxypeptidase regulatory-like domain
MKGAAKSLFGIWFSLTLLSPALWAQATAQISGTVADQSGARLPGAEVTATQTDTGLSRTVVTNETGTYILASLPTGPYKLEVALPGFRSFVQTGIVLDVNANPVINVALAVGQVTETVEVQANASLVETRNVGVGQLMETQRILELPLNGRNVTELITLAGAAVQTAVSSTRGMQNQADIRVAGGLAGSVAYALDGALHTNRYDNLSLPLPFPDALQEFKVETSGLAASQGLSAGAQVNAVTKSGTNEFHGDVFEFVRNDLFNATEYFAAVDPATGKKKHSTLKRNQYGGTIGGPIVRNKLFFFGGYQGTPTRSDPVNTQSFVPTPAMLAGDFTKIAPLRSISPVDGTPTGFVNNRIDPSLLSPVALNIAKRLPKAQDDTGLVTSGTPNRIDEKQIVAKGDWQLNASHSIMGRILFNNYKQPQPYSLAPDNLLTVSRNDRNEWAYSYAVGDTWLLSPKTVISGRLVSNFTHISRHAPQFFDMAEMGVKGLYTGYVPKFAQLLVSPGGFRLGDGTQTLSNATTFTTSLNLDASMTRGTHQIGLGGSVAYWDFNSHGNVFSSGSFTVTGSHTGSALADFLIGRMSTFEQATPNLNPTKHQYFALFMTDSWKVSQRWTLNYGLRWEPDLPDVLKFGTVQTFSEERRAAGAHSTVFKNAPNGFFYPGDPGYPGKRGRDINWLVLAPRAGFAWDVNGDGRTSVRASAGIGYDYLNGEAHLWTAISPPWGLDIIRNNPRLEDPWAGYPGGSPFPPVYDANATFPPFGQFTVMPTRLSPSQSQTWNLSVQRQLGTDWLVSASYLGTHVIHMLVTAPLNPAVYFPGTADANGNCFAPGYTFKTTSGATCSTTTNTDSRRILSLIDSQQTGRLVGALAEYQSVGGLKYNGLLLDVRKRAARGITVSSNYTWSHCVASERDDLNGSLLSPAATYIRVGDRERGRTNCGSDRRHVVNLSAVAESPQFANRTLRIVGSGWRLAPIYRISTGQWLSITAGGGLDSARNGTAVADQPADQILPNVYKDKSGGPYTYWLNKDAFAQPALGTIGNMNRRTVRAPHTWSFDMALSRDFRLQEKQRIEFRVEAYNVTNSFRPDATPGLPVPSTNFSTLNYQYFGQIRASLAPRIMQFALKYLF